MFEILDKVLKGGYVFTDDKGKLAIGNKEESRNHYRCCMNEMDQCTSCLILQIKDNELQCTKRKFLTYLKVIVEQFQDKSNFDDLLWKEVKGIQKSLREIQKEVKVMT